MRLLKLLSLCLLLLALAACGSAAAATPTKAPAAPTKAAATRSSRPTASTAAISIIPSPQPTTMTGTVSAGQPTTTTSTSSGDERVFTIDPTQSTVTLKVQEQLADASVNSDAVLKTDAIAGKITVLPDGKVAPGSQITVELNSLQSDRAMRDRFIKGRTLNVGEFPQAVFVPKEFQGLPNPLPSSGEITGKLLGDMTIHGVTKPVTIDVAGTIDGNTFKGTGTTSMKITDFGMTLPNVPVVASIEDLARLEVQLVATTS